MGEIEEKYTFFKCWSELHSQTTAYSIENPLTVKKFSMQHPESKLDSFSVPSPAEEQDLHAS